MSKRDGKTEAPTERKKREARKKGTVARSPDLGPWVAVLAATFVLPVLVRRLGASVTGAMESMRVVAEQPEPTLALRLLGRALRDGLFAVMPFLLVCAAVGAGAQVLQGGLVLSLHPLKPDLKRLSPIRGVKKLFSARSLWETGKQVAKAVVIGWLCLPHVQDLNEALTSRGRVPLLAGIAATGEELLAMTRTVCLAIIIIALADFVYQRRAKLLDLRMTKQEVRDEMRNTEGDPLVRQRIRSMRLAMSRKRMMGAVPSATVIVTNPTHIAVALRYDPLAGGAPKVVAIGVDAVAARIREKALDAGVPIVEAKPLARALWRACEVGDEIPVALYEAVAKVLAFVRRLRGSLLAAATVVPLPSSYHVDPGALEAVTAAVGRRRRRRLAT